MKNVIKNLTLLHLSMLISMIAFMAVIIYMVKQNGGFEFGIDERLLQVVVLVVAGAAFLFSKQFFARKLVIIRAEENFAGKQHGYFQASIIQWAIIDAGVMLCITAYTLVQNIAFLVLAGFLIVYFILLRQNHVENADTGRNSSTG